MMDEILLELGKIRDRLGVEVDRLERAVLLERRNELRAEARRINPETKRDLAHQLAGLVAAWERLQAQRIDLVKQAGGGSSGGDFGFAADALRLNQKIDLAAGREELEERIRDLKVKLREFEVE